MLQLYRNSSPVSPVLNVFTYSGAFMSDRSITATIELNEPFDFAVNDYIIYPATGEKFYLDYIPTAKKTSTFNFTYDLKFIPSQRELSQCDFLDVVEAGNDANYTEGSIVEFYGDLNQLRGRIQANLNRIYTGDNSWTVNIGIDPATSLPYETDYVSISLTDSKVWDAILLCYSEFELNFNVIGKTITLGYSVSNPFGSFKF